MRTTSLDGAEAGRQDQDLEAAENNWDQND